MLRFFTLLRLALNPNLIFEIGSIYSILIFNELMLAKAAISNSLYSITSICPSIVKKKAERQALLNEGLLVRLKK